MTLMLEPHLARAWMELPVLVDEFVASVAPSMHWPRERLRDAICTRLGLDSYSELGFVCRALGEIVPLLKLARDEMNFEFVGSFDKERTALVAAALQAWHDNEEEVGALSEVDADSLEPLESLPWRSWSAWERDGDPVPPSRIPPDAPTTWLGNALVEDAHQLVSRFMDDCAEWRATVLDAFTLVSVHTPVGVLAIDEAEALLAELGGERGSTEGISRLLAIRGFAHLHAPDIARIQQQRKSDEPPALQGWQKERFDALLRRADLGDGPVGARELRKALRWVPPGHLDGAYESGPAIWQALAQLPADAYVELTTGATAGLALFATAYVERMEDIARVLRCTGHGAEKASIVSREELLDMGCPHLAGCIAVSWWE